MGFLIWFHQSFFLMIFLFMSLGTSSSSSSGPLCSKDQSFSLLQFKSMFSIDLYASSSCNISGVVSSFPKTETWVEGTDCCSWSGVRCDNLTGQVVGLDLSCSQLHGAIHENSSLFRLSHLRNLNLAHNNFYKSHISPGFGELKNLMYLNLSSSRFSGPVASEISSLSELVSLDLSENNELILDTQTVKKLVQKLIGIRELSLSNVSLSLAMPSSFDNLSPSLTSLHLSSSGLQGKFPMNIFHLPNLQFLNLSFNPNISGNLPNSNWGSSLRVLDLSSTSFSGELPDSVGNLTSLKSLQISSCRFNGSISPSLGKLKELTILDLSGNNFSGQFPSSVLSLQKLTHLDISQNNLTGRILNEMVGFSSLSFLDFSENQFVGYLPSWLYSLPSLQLLRLSKNKLAGSIGDFQKSLEVIDMSNNRFNGPVPASIFELLNLTRLELQWNNLSGTVEIDNISKLQNLNSLDLSHNHLSVITKSNSKMRMSKLESLSLASCNLTEFPSLLRTTKNLMLLDLSNNRIYGEIPNWFFNVGNESLLFLNLTKNLITSVELTPWRNLGTIDLRSNLLEGPVPMLPPATTYFSISNNNISGEIPAFICNMSLFRILDLSINNLTGTIPPCLGNFSNRLTVLDLRMNNFRGLIPGTFVEGNILRNLDLDGNQLEGPLPRSLVVCHKLEVLDLGNNLIKDIFPYWLETLAALQVLVLRSNKFYGPISAPQANISFPRLRIFDLSKNQFSGPLPAKHIENFKAMMAVDQGKSEVQYMGERFCQDTIVVTMKGFQTQLLRILTIFTTIDLSSNKFYGEIPESIGMLLSLRQLNLSHNSLSGHIPSSLGNLSVLESLDLSSNKITGEIPEQLTGLTFLAMLDISHNELSGPIPRGKQFDTFQNNSFLGNKDLCGSPLSKKCDRGDAFDHPPSNEDEGSESGSKLDWIAVIVGYGCGLMFGIFVCILLITEAKSKQILALIEDSWYGFKWSSPFRRSQRE